MLPLAFYAIELYSIADVIRLSLYKWTTLSPPKFVGLANFATLLGDTRIQNSFVNTFKWAAVSILASITIPLLIALLLNERLRGENIYKILFILPQALSGVAVGMILHWVFSPTYGILNMVLRAMGLGMFIHGWLGDPNTALYSLIAATIWAGMGFQLMIYLTRLRGLPKDIFEAARVDGANFLQTFRHITLPLMKPAFAIVVTMAILGAFTAFDIILTMTRGGPKGATETAALMIYLIGWWRFKMGYASAISVILLLSSLPFVILYMRMIVKGR